MMRKPMSALLWERLAKPGILIARGAFDAVSARIMQDAGCQSMGLSTAVASATLPGKADMGLING